MRKQYEYDLYLLYEIKCSCTHKKDDIFFKFAVVSVTNTPLKDGYIITSSTPAALISPFQRNMTYFTIVGTFRYVFLRSK